jgi:hypothetical protein
LASPSDATLDRKELFSTETASTAAYKAPSHYETT